MEQWNQDDNPPASASLDDLDGIHIVDVVDSMNSGGRPSRAPTVGSK